MSQQRFFTFPQSAALNTDLVPVKRIFADGSGSGSFEVPASSLAGLASSLGPFAGDFIEFPPYEGNASNGHFQWTLATIGKLSVLPVFIDRNIVLTQGQVSVMTAATTPGTFYYVMIYSVDGGTLLGYLKFPIDTINRHATVSVIGGPITLTPGIYKFAVACDEPAQIAIGANYLFDSDFLNMIPGGGTSSLSIVAGVPPTTLGVVTQPWPYSAPYVCLY